jgi:hypothetical protein
MHQVPSILITILITILIPLVCFIVVLLLLRFSVKASWLTAIAASVVVTTIPSLLGIRMLLGGPGIMVGWLLLFLLPAVICAVILVVQFLRWLPVAGDNAAVNTAERSRILKMVEDGKISTDEGAELLDAMGRSSALRGQDRFSRLDIAMLVGVALVILGFFLPWGYLGRGIYQAGHHRGPVGWTVFIVAIISAVPVFVTPKDLLYKVSMLQIFLILVGLALMLKELIVINEHLGAGLIFCAAGFFVSLLSSAAKLKSLAA